MAKGEKCSKVTESDCLKFTKMARKGAYSEHSISMVGYVIYCVLRAASLWAEQFV